MIRRLLKCLNIYYQIYRVKGGKSDIFHYDPFLCVLFKNFFKFFYGA